MQTSPRDTDTSTGTGTQATPAIACDLAAIAAEERDAHIARAATLMFDASEERRELPDGYAWRFAADQYGELVAYIANERRCCPFFTFTLEVTPAGGPIWLRLTGDDAVKAFLRAELAAHSQSN
jgi:hypothetical protein